MHFTLINTHTGKKGQLVREQLHCCLKGSSSMGFGSVIHRGNSHAPGIILLCPVLPRPQKSAPTLADHETRERHARIRNLHPTLPFTVACPALLLAHLIYMHNVSTAWSTGSDRWSQVNFHKFCWELRS